jgi:hypothetical protein
MSDVRSRAKLSVSALAERKIASARPRKYGLLLRAEEEMLLYGQALTNFSPLLCGVVFVRQAALLVNERGGRELGCEASEFAYNAGPPSLRVATQPFRPWTYP